MADPRDIIRAWLPHLAMVALAMAALGWLLVVIGPVRDALLFAVALALLTYPIAYRPFDAYLERHFPALDAQWRRYLLALLATVAVAAAVVALILSLLWAVVGSLGGTLDALIGVALHDRERIDQVVGLLADRAARIAAAYPDLPIDVEAVRRTVSATLHEVSVGPAMLRYLVTGAGSVIAQAALTLITLFYLYSQGPWLARTLLSWLQLDDAQRDQVRLSFHSTALHLLAGTLGRAGAHGIVLGLLAWLIGGFHPVLVASVAAFVAMLPVVGPAVSWMPLAGALWSQGLPVTAVSLALASIAAAWLVERAATRLAVVLGTHDLWLSFLVFLSLVGGVVGFGLRGLLLGPAAVLVTVVVVGNVLPRMYGRRDEGVSRS